MSFLRCPRLVFGSFFPVALLFAGVALPVVAQAQQIPGLIVSVPTEDSNNSQSGSAPSVTQSGRVPNNPLLNGGLGGAARVPEAQPQEKRKPSVQRKKSASISRSTRNPKNVRKRGRGNAAQRTARSRRKHSIAILVNDEPITNHEIDQRARLLSLRANLGNRAKANFQSLIEQKSTNQRLRSLLRETIEANPGKTRDEILAKFELRKRNFAKSLQRQAVKSARAQMLPRFRQSAKTELVEERLKMQEAKKLKIVASTAAVDRAITNIAKRNKATTKQFFANLQRSGIRRATFRDKIKAQISWVGVVRRKFGRTIAFNMKDIDQQVGAAGSNVNVALKLQQISLNMPASGFSQAIMASRLRDAELLQRKFTSCKGTRALAGTVQNAVFKDLGTVKRSTIAEPTRSMLLQASNGQMLPPVISGRGVVLYAICGRDAAAGKQKARVNARDQLRQREFEVRGRRHLADLKRDAHIEYR